MGIKILKVDGKPVKPSRRQESNERMSQAVKKFARAIMAGRPVRRNCRGKYINKMPRKLIPVTAAGPEVKLGLFRRMLNWLRP